MIFIDSHNNFASEVVQALLIDRGGKDGELGRN